MERTVLLRQEFLDGGPTARGRTDLMVADWVVILAFVARYKQPKPFVWTANTEKILAKVNRCKTMLNSLH